MACGLLLCAAVQAQPITERTRQKQAAEKEQADLQQRLTTLKRDIDQTETAKDNAADALAASEQAISKANRSLRDLAQEQQATEARLAQLVKQLNELTALVNAQQAQLSKLLREQYVAGNEDRIKLLLSGDNPNRINRELQYMGYVSQAQAKLIETLRANQQAIRANKADTQNAKFELDEIAQEEQEQKKVLEREKGRRQTLLSQLSTKLNAQRQEAGRIEQDQQRLSSLVDKLAQIIEQQKKAEAEAREKRRQEQLAKAKAEREKRLAEQRARAEKRAAEAARAPRKASRRLRCPIRPTPSMMTSRRNRLPWAAMTRCPSRRRTISASPLPACADNCICRSGASWYRNSAAAAATDRPAGACSCAHRKARKCGQWQQDAWSSRTGCAVSAT